MRTLAWMAGLALLAGCATVESPHTLLQQMNTKAPRYETEECRLARQDALAYDENVGGRVGAGIAIGLLLGPVGLPLAVAGDAAQAEKRKAAVAQLRDACEGELPGGPSAAAMLRLREDMARLDAERSQGGLAEAEYRSRREALVSRYLDANTAERPASLFEGAELVVRDREPVSGAVLHETRLVVSAVQPEAVVFNGGELSVWRRTAVWRDGRWPGVTLSGFEAGRLRPADRLKARFRPASAEDETVQVELHVEREEPVAAGNDSVMLLRVRVSGYASQLGPYQTPQAWRGARMDGLVWIDRTSGLVVRAAVDCPYPTYAWKRDLVRIAMPAARP